MNKIYCPLNYTMKLIGTKWKPLVLFYLLEGPIRSGKLQNKIPDISNKMFTQTVRELEIDNLINRKVYPVVPPKVEYELAEKEKSPESILRSLDAWEKKYPLFNEPGSFWQYYCQRSSITVSYRLN